MCVCVFLSLNIFAHFANMSLCLSRARTFISRSRIFVTKKLKIQSKSINQSYVVVLFFFLFYLRHYLSLAHSKRTQWARLYECFKVVHTIQPYQVNFNINYILSSLVFFCFCSIRSNLIQHAMFFGNLIATGSWKFRVDFFSLWFFSYRKYFHSRNYDKELQQTYGYMIFANQSTLIIKCLALTNECSTLNGSMRRQHFFLVYWEDVAIASKNFTMFVYDYLL